MRTKNEAVGHKELSRGLSVKVVRCFIGRNAVGQVYTNRDRTKFELSLYNPKGVVAAAKSYTTLVKQATRDARCTGATISFAL